MTYLRKLNLTVSSCFASTTPPRAEKSLSRLLILTAYSSEQLAIFKLFFNDCSSTIGFVFSAVLMTPRIIHSLDLRLNNPREYKENTREEEDEEKSLDTEKHHLALAHSSLRAANEALGILRTRDYSSRVSVVFLK